MNLTARSTRFLSRFHLRSYSIASSLRQDTAESIIAPDHVFSGYYNTGISHKTMAICLIKILFFSQAHLYLWMFVRDYPYEANLLPSSKLPNNRLNELFEPSGASQHVWISTCLWLNFVKITRDYSINSSQIISRYAYFPHADQFPFFDIFVAGICSHHLYPNRRWSMSKVFRSLPLYSHAR